MIATASLGEALATDYFLVREQLSAEQWENFIRTRRFVDHEVLPAINGYWERAELPWPLITRLGELGLVGEDIEGYGCPGMSPLRAGWSTWSCTAATAASGPSSESIRALP
jgi:glutaryl-CoA dehydrogenase